MMKIQVILLLCVSAAWAADPIPRAGCEANPCQHRCIDQGDSYFCECFTNYVLHPDRHSCTHMNSEAIENIYMGCWQDFAEHRDLQYLIWTRPSDASVTECLHDCRARGFSFAGLQNGDQCWCDNTHQRAYNETGVCNLNCPGAPSSKCGGVLSNSIYKINRDEHYLGCFYEEFNDPDLPELQWGNTEGKSVDNCLKACSQLGYNFAGMYDGGQCACGNSYGKHGAAEEKFCDVKCYNGWANDNCGGNATNAVYRVVRGQDLTGLLKSEDIRADVPLSNIYVYPHHMGLYTERMMIYATDIVNTVSEDVACTNGDCYSLCGSISHPPGLDKYKTNVTIRDFYLKLSDIPARISNPTETERVFVFVQTLYVDQTVSFDWSMYIHARQIIINYEVEPVITFDHTGPILGVDIDAAVVYGMPSDLTFQKLSLLCAKMMVSSTDESDRRVGWNIIDDMARAQAYNSEQQHFLDNIRAIRSEFTSIGRNNVHYVPYYSKDFYVKTLEVFYDQITIYHNEFTAMLDSAIDCQNFVDRAGALIHVWTDAVISQAQIVQQYAYTALNTSAEVYQSVYASYNASIEHVDDAQVDFEEGLRKWRRQQAVKAMFGFIGSIFKLARGKFPCGALDVARDLHAATDGVVIGLELLEVTMENLAKTNEELSAFLQVADYIIESEDYQRYMDHVESVAALHVMINEWDNFRYQVDVIFREEEFADIGGAQGYRDAVIEMCNWGEELTRSVTEYATHIRRYMTTSALVDLKIEMQEKYREYFEEVQADCTKQEQMLIMFAEQHYDIMLELNDQLIQLCQATFYETMQECPASVQPNFGYSVDSLLSSIYSAIQYVQGLSRYSPGTIQITIEDHPEAWNNCTTTDVCPVKVMRDTGTLYYKLSLDNPRFTGIDLFLVEEISVVLNGATHTGSRSDLRLLVSSSGPFYNRRSGETAVFLTRAVSEMKFQYDIETDEIELATDLYRPSGAMIRHMTPFTTWIVLLDPNFTHIDISQVQSVTMEFTGPFTNLNARKPHLA